MDNWLCYWASQTTIQAVWMRRRSCSWCRVLSGGSILRVARFLSRMLLKARKKWYLAGKRVESQLFWNRGTWKFRTWWSNRAAKRHMLRKTGIWVPAGIAGASSGIRCLEVAKSILCISYFRKRNSPWSNRDRVQISTSSLLCCWLGHLGSKLACTSMLWTVCPKRTEAKSLWTHRRKSRTVRSLSRI